MKPKYHPLYNTMDLAAIFLHHRLETLPGAFAEEMMTGQLEAWTRDRIAVFRGTLTKLGFSNPSAETDLIAEMCPPLETMEWDEMAWGPRMAAEEEIRRIQETYFKMG
jgi:hypothetical protein